MKIDQTRIWLNNPFSKGDWKARSHETWVGAKRRRAGLKAKTWEHLGWGAT
jgi:hypothetical protein